MLQLVNPSYLKNNQLYSRGLQKLYQVPKEA